MTISDKAAPAFTINYPLRNRADLELGYNSNILDNAHADLLKAGGATITRFDGTWTGVEDYATGNLSLSATYQTHLTYCASQQIKVLINALFGPPYATIGTFTVSSDVPSGSVAGTPIPGSYVGTPMVANSTDFAGGLLFNFAGNGLTAATADYGDMISQVSAGSIQIAKSFKASMSIAAGTQLKIQRLRYAPPFTDKDPLNPANTHPSIAAAMRYRLFLANQLAAFGVQGWVGEWNELVWARDPWNAPGVFYDVKPAFITLSQGAQEFLVQDQLLALPAGVKIVNGLSDKSGGNAAVSRGIAGTNIEYESVHTYGNDPEQECLSFFGWGQTEGKFKPPASWPPSSADAKWDTVILADKPNSTFIGLDFAQQLKPGGPWSKGVMVTETGLQTANDEAQARFDSRKLLANWGSGRTKVIFTRLDSGADPGGNIFDVAPSLTPRQSYTALQSIIQVLNRMDANQAAASVPMVIGWPTSLPMMSVRAAGAKPGNYVLFAWQRTFTDSQDSVNRPWTAIESPPSRPVSVYLPAGLMVAECFDVVSGLAVTVTTAAAKRITVPITDNPVAIRFAPAPA